MPRRMRGTVIRLLPNKGYGFVRDQEGRTRFFHAKAFVVSGDFDLVMEGFCLEFEPVNLEDQRLRCEQVEIIRDY